MMSDKHDQCADMTQGVALLSRRAIEAQIVAPIVEAMSKTLGREQALALVEAATTDVARRQGGAFRSKVGEGGLAAFAGVLALWREADALTIEMLEQNEHRLDFNVTRCRYADMYARCGMKPLGRALSCARDFAFVEGFNADISLVRIQTILEGAPFCDFRFSLK